MAGRFSRRDFLCTAATAASALAWPSSLRALQRAVDADPWARADAIVRSITIPRFPSRDFDITTFGASGYGAASCTASIRRAIAACRAAGVGRVVVPKGRFLTGAIRLES